MRPTALLFDMDGTITCPMLDFPAIRAEAGIAAEDPILEAMSKMPAGARQRAEEVLHRHEERAAAEAGLNAGCIELFDWLSRHALPAALITRNSRRSVEVVLARHRLPIEVIITRDDGLFKPDPRPLLLACHRLGAAPDQAWMIGDGRHDIEAGLAAGMKTVWLSHGRQRDFRAEPWRVVCDLHELLNVLRPCVSHS